MHRTVISIKLQMIPGKYRDGALAFSYPSGFFCLSGDFSSGTDDFRTRTDNLLVARGSFPRMVVLLGNAINANVRRV